MPKAYISFFVFGSPEKNIYFFLRMNYFIKRMLYFIQKLPFVSTLGNVEFNELMHTFGCPTL